MGLILLSWVNVGITYYILNEIKDGDPAVGEQDTLDFQMARAFCCFIVIFMIVHELMQSVHTLLQILMVGIEDVRESHLDNKEKAKIEICKEL